jgi:hypothetical protein
MSEKSQLIQEAVSLTNECRKAGGQVRIFGGIAAAMVGAKWFEKNPRYARTPGDIDLVGRKEDLTIFRRVAATRGYREAKHVVLETEGGRALFASDDCAVDFAGDEILFCQSIKVRSRLTLSYPTLSPGDLALEKLQIAEPSNPSFVDFIAIVSSVGVSGLDPLHLKTVLGNNWGFWYSAKRFLKRAKEFATNERLDDVVPMLIELDLILDSIRKSIRWRLRSLFGTLIPWHAPVELLSANEKKF